MPEDKELKVLKERKDVVVEADSADKNSVKRPRSNLKAKERIILSRNS